MKLPYLFAALSLSAAAPASLRVSIAPVTKTTFHVVAYLDGSAPPPPSPFVVRKDTGRAQTIKPEAQGGFSLPGGTRFPKLTLAETKDGIVLTLTHEPGDRLYGAGNLDRDRSGSLMHPTGSQIVGNGVTRVPFLWSTGGWSALVANNQLGVSWRDESGRLTFSLPGSYLDCYLTAAPTGYALLDAYSDLTGRAPIPPRWTFGFMVSRWGYKNAADIQDKWIQFRRRNLPVDAFIYDYDWFTDDWKFNPNNFPEGSLAKMKELGLRFVGIRKPRVNGPHEQFARQQGWALNSPQGVDLRFDVPAARHWWWSRHIPLVNAGVDGWWNDEAEQTYDEFFYMTQTQWDGGRAIGPNRVWSLNRAFAPGISRFGTAFWTGDIDSNWETMAEQPGILLNWSLAGNPFVGQDLGGFIGQPSPELYARWIEQGVFQPIMRTHGMLDLDRWPWAFGEEVLTSTRKAIELRYRLIPHLYTLAERAAATGAPMVRPLFLEFPQAPKAFDLRDQWLLGDRLLAAPVLTSAKSRDVYLPAGKWFDFNSGTVQEGGKTIRAEAPLGTIPAFVRAGSILPLGPVVPSTKLDKRDSLDIRVYPGANAAYTLYEDDGETYDYEKGHASRIFMRWNDRSRILTIEAPKGSFIGMPGSRIVKVTLPDGTSRNVVYSGRKVDVRF